ncbi:aspartate aminotransferase family protein [Candidatus Nitrososphaera sp. FF02]|uniref:aspartate aminotransferase family protein n=1 Tax=Candidatus Nitrososphaera sp. FF02 TaxID=3398226 RepID=UPI0039EABE33
MARSEQLHGRAKKTIPGGVNSPVRFYEPYPFFAVSATGSKMVTTDHKTLLDYCMGYGAMLLGHGYPSVLNAVKSQLDKGTLYCVPTEQEVKLAETIAKAVPCAEMVRLVNTGSEATMHAIRLARAFAKKKGVIKFDGGYHGAHDYVLAKAGSGAASMPASEGVLEEAAAFTKIVPYNDAPALERAIEKNRDTACLIMEPVLANIGLVLPDKNYLSEVRKITQQNDMVLIFDEVVTGFRLALGGAGEFFGIKPDIATFAKALGNGFPVGAVAGRKEIMQQLAPAGRVYQASTFAGNPVSVAAATAALGTLIESKNAIYPQVARTCDSLVEGIKEELEDMGGVECTINSIGSMFQIFFTGDRVRDEASARKADAVKFRRLFDELLKRNVFIPPSQFETCFISYAHDEEDVDRTVDAYSESLKKIKEQK